jgi:Winged helix-turn-helix DNA-binding
VQYWDAHERIRVRRHRPKHGVGLDPGRAADEHLPAITGETGRPMRALPEYKATARRTAIVLVLARAPSDVSIEMAVLAKAVGCSPTTVHRHVKALVATGVLRKPPWRVYREEGPRTRAKIMAAVERLGSNTPLPGDRPSGRISTTRVREHLVAMGWRRPHGGEARRQRHLEVQGGHSGGA